MTYFNKPSDLAPVTKARSVDINNLAALIAAAFGKLPDELDLKMGTVNYAVNTGPNGAAYSVVMASAIKAYADGLEVKMRPVKDNTGACTLNVNGLGAIAIKRADGTDPQAGDILGNTPITLTYQSTGNVFRLPAVVNSQIIQAASSSAQAEASAAAAAGSAAIALKTLAIESNDPPANPMEGQEWIDAATGRRFTFIEGQWAETYAAQVVDQPTLVDGLRTSLDLVSVLDFGADDSGAVNAKNVDAFTKAAAKGKNVTVPKPAVSYYLAADPVIPENVSIIASADWFSGPGKLPVHYFSAISEGVDPRIFSTKGAFVSTTEPNETKRKWSLLGWVWARNSPKAGYEGYPTDAVGVDGRGVADAPNARVWGLLGLAHMTAKAWQAGAAWVSQAYACELDVNNNTGVNSTGFDGAGGGPIGRGLAIVSGGSNGPSEALMFQATKTPDNGQGDNRWHTLIRAYRDSVRSYVIHIDDAVTALFARIPSSSSGMRWTHQEAINYAEYQDKNSFRRVFWSQTAGYGYSFVDSTGKALFRTYDGRTEFAQPLAFSNTVLAAPITLDASKQDVFVLTAGQAAITGGITGAVNGQRITVWNLSGAPITLSRTATMRTAGGAAVTINNLCCVEFHYLAPTYFQIGPTNNA
jgi:hypothetical protein